MRNYLFSIKNILLFILIIVAASCTPMGFIKLSEGELQHQNSGVCFPKQIGNFFRSNPNNYDYTGKDVGVGYNLRKQDCSITFTFYVYPHKDQELDEGFKEVEKAIEYYYPSNQKISRDKSVYVQDDMNISGLHAVYRLYLDTNGTSLISQAYLFKYGTNFIKYRVTYHEAFENCVQKELHLLMKEIKWIITN